MSIRLLASCNHHHRAAGSFVPFIWNLPVFFLISDNLAFHSFVASCLFFSEYKNYFAETSINIFLINRPGLINVFIKACISCYSSGCGCRTSFSAAAIPWEFIYSNLLHLRQQAELPWLQNNRCRTFLSVRPNLQQHSGCALAQKVWEH